MTVVGTGREPLEALADAAARVAASEDAEHALALLAAAAVEATDADLALVRAVDERGSMAARAVAPEASALAAELAGSHAAREELEAGDVPAATRRAAERLRAAGVHVEPVLLEGRIAGSLELIRVAAPFDAAERRVAGVLAA